MAEAHRKLGSGFVAELSALIPEGSEPSEAARPGRTSETHRPPWPRGPGRTDRSLDSLWPSGTSHTLCARCSNWTRLALRPGRPDRSAHSRLPLRACRSSRTRGTLRTISSRCTLNTLYAMLSVFVYRIEDEAVALEGVREQVPQILAFLATLKRHYQHGMDFIQGPHLQLRQ